MHLFFLVILLLHMSIALKTVNAARIRGNKNRQHLRSNDGNGENLAQPPSAYAVQTAKQGDSVSTLQQRKKGRGDESASVLLQQKHKEGEGRKRVGGVTPQKPLTEDDHKGLKFTYDPQHPLSTEQIRQIRDPVNRARACKPTDRVQLLKTHRGSDSEWITLDQTNAQYVAEKMNLRRERARKVYKAQTEQLASEEIRTGVVQTTKENIRARRRLTRARKGAQDEIILFSHKGRTFNDPKGRTRSEYVAEQKAKHRQEQKRYVAKREGRSQSKQKEQEQEQAHVPDQAHLRTKPGPQIDLNRSPPSDPG